MGLGPGRQPRPRVARQLWPQSALPPQPEVGFGVNPEAGRLPASVAVGVINTVGSPAGGRLDPRLHSHI